MLDLESNTIVDRLNYFSLADQEICYFNPFPNKPLFLTCLQ